MTLKEIKDYDTSKILDSIPTSLLVIDRNKDIIEANPAAKELLGSDIENKNIENIFHEVEKGTFDRVLEGNTIQRIETEICGKTIGFSASPLFSSTSEITGASIILRDITGIKEMERELRRKDRLAALGEMAAGMAHEIRNPLAAIKAGIESLRKHFDKESRGAQYISIIQKEIERLNRIVKDMSTYAFQKPLKKKKIKLNNLINHTIVMFQQELNEKNIEVVKKFSGEISCYADEDSMITVLNNLIINAIDAIENSGKIEIELSENEEKIILVIRDNGRGITEEEIRKIFIPFYTTKNKGSGLGLSIINRIIQDHEGNIDISTHDNKTEFKIEMPKGI